MVSVSKEDIEALCKGLPPHQPELIEFLTVPNDWLQIIKGYCLEDVIARGGSKVKILHGSPATGKSHYLHDIRVHARKQGFFEVYLDLMLVGFHLTNSIDLYKAIAEKVDIELLADKLTTLLLEALGYDVADFAAFGGELTDYLCKKENSDPIAAKRDIRMAIHKIVNHLDIDFSFRKFLHMFMEAVVEKDTDFMDIARNWLRGNKIERSYKVHSSLYETLTRINARIWLYSLVELIKLMGFRGVVILLDHFEAILPKSDAKITYTLSKRNDVYELLRQLIDDLDFFRNILILIAGNSEILDNEKYGLQSYHALWMRIQPGFKQDFGLNPYADLTDANQILLQVNSTGGLERLQEKLHSLGMDANIYETDKSETAHPEIVNYREIVQERMKNYHRGEMDDKHYE
jgi:hypothetical protein